MKFSWIVIIVFCSSFLAAQEICNNGIDDDGDGLVDLNDGEDCSCKDSNYVYISGDFEENICCPSSLTLPSVEDDGIHCLSGNWTSASMNTPDYFNKCDYLGGGSGGVPLAASPLPSGDGFVGLYTNYGDSIVPGILFQIPAYQEVIGQCLEKPFQSGQSFNLSFYIGEGISETLTSQTSNYITIYGTPTCLDFPVASNEVGCLVDHGQWQTLAKVPVTVELDSWSFIETTFTSNIDASAIAIGVDCESVYFDYYFFDDITIESIDHEVEEISLLLTECQTGATLEVSHDSGSSYQWYSNGIAISGATMNEYSVNANENGVYQVLVDDGTKCKISPPLDVDSGQFSKGQLGMQIDKIESDLYRIRLNYFDKVDILKECKYDDLFQVINYHLLTRASSTVKSQKLFQNFCDDMIRLSSGDNMPLLEKITAVGITYDQVKIAEMTHDFVIAIKEGECIKF